MLSYKVKVEWMKLWAIVGLTKEKSKSRSKYHFKSPPSTNIKHIQTKHQADALPHHQAKKESKKKKRTLLYIYDISTLSYYSLSIIPYHKPMIHNPIEKLLSIKFLKKIFLKNMEIFRK